MNKIAASVEHFRCLFLHYHLFTLLKPNCLRCPMKIVISSGVMVSIRCRASNSKSLRTLARGSVYCSLLRNFTFSSSKAPTLFLDYAQENSRWRFRVCFWIFFLFPFWRYCIFWRFLWSAAESEWKENDLCGVHLEVFFKVRLVEFYVHSFSLCCEEEGASSE